jgi:demethylmenaquinone methyltransferase/2-methoxy-6-polyprenyl-1,4-benzoquinol methylase
VALNGGTALPPPEAKYRAVQSMFDRIAPRYDLVNRLMTFGLDQRWRHRALDAIGVDENDLVVDLACGTGDLAQQARERGARVVGLDFAREMLRGARSRGIDARFAQADGARLPLADAAATALVCGFALRNFVSLPDVFDEMARVLAPGGRIALIEVDRPSIALVRLGHSLYFDRVVPRIGALLSDRAAYAYLPESTRYLPAEAELHAMLQKAGFGAIRKMRHLLGAAQTLSAVRT